jgi:hypothetical protein
MTTPSGGFSRTEKLDFIKLEMTLLQTRFDKYDDLIWRGRNWMMTVTAAFIGWSVAQKDDAIERELLFVAALVPILFWLSEFVIRVGYASRYVHRYRVVRDAVNSGDRESWLTLPIYDVSSSIEGRPSLSSRVFDVLANPEPLLFYGLFVLIVFLTNRFT